ncbi:MAG TPA: hypothetical protein VI997_04945 [Candidatus Thermoplasmatota archaeon]|nr:hypothetical protein [Candidatus Thermoplasmatota archaeon]
MPRTAVVRVLALAAVLAVPLAVADLPVAVTEQPDQGVCAGPIVGALITVVCAFSGTGTAAECPASGNVPVVVACTHTRSFAWRAFSNAQLPGEATVTVAHEVRVCEDRIDAEPACAVEAVTETVTCAWGVAGACRDSARFDGATAPVALGMGEQLKVLVSVQIKMDAWAELDGVVARRDVHWEDASDAGAAVEVRDDGRP